MDLFKKIYEAATSPRWTPREYIISIIAVRARARNKQISQYIALQKRAFVQSSAHSKELPSHKKNLQLRVSHEQLAHINTPRIAIFVAKTKKKTTRCVPLHLGHFAYGDVHNLKRTSFRLRLFV